MSENGQSSGLSSDGAILLIDDNPAVASAMEIAFRMAGRQLHNARGPEEALSRLANRRFDAILLDMNFTPGQSNGEEGLSLLSRIMTDNPESCIVVLTAHSGVRIAVAAMQAGARDFAMKPWRNSELLSKVEAAISRGTPPSSASLSWKARSEPFLLLGESSAMKRLRDLIRRVAPTPAGVTVTGPPGSGRTLTALVLHAASGFGEAEPVRIDLRDTSMWTRLEGQTGTVILRYPDKLSDVMQARLLDHLQPTARCIAVADDIATLTPALRHRIATVELAVPPLSQREDDSILLARHFVRVAAERFGRSTPLLTAAAEEAIRSTAWADEVRGLALAIERAVLLSDGGAIEAAALALPANQILADSVGTSFDLSDAEKAMIEAALREHRHNISHAAKALGLSRGALYRRMVRYGL